MEETESSNGKADNKSWICIRFTQISGTGVSHCTPWFTLSHNVTKGKYLIVLHSLVQRFSLTTGEEGDKYLFVSGFMYFVNALHPLAHSLSHNVRVVNYLMDAWIVCIFLFTLSLSQRERGEINMFVSRFMYFVNTLHPFAHPLSQWESSELSDCCVNVVANGNE